MNTTWMLQPHNYTQALRPNLYNVSYRRTGTYKGLGRWRHGMGQATSTICGSCDPTTDPICAAACAGTPVTSLPVSGYGSQSPVYMSVPAGTDWTTYLPWIAGALLLALMIKK